MRGSRERRGAGQGVGKGWIVAVLGMGGRATSVRAVRLVCNKVRRPSPSIPPGSPSPPSLRRSRPKWARAASRARRRSQRTEQSVSRSPVSPRACAPGSNLVPPGLRSERARVAQSGACSDRGTDVSPDPVSAEPARYPREKIPSRRLNVSSSPPLPASAAQNVDTGGVDLVGEWAPHGVSWTGSRGTGCAMRSTQSRQCPSERTQTVAAPRFLRPSSTPRHALQLVSSPPSPHPWCPFPPWESGVRLRRRRRRRAGVDMIYSKCSCVSISGCCCVWCVSL